MIGYVFSGQGSQSLGMGVELFEKYADLINISDKILGWSVKDIVLNHGNLLELTQYTQPALYIINSLMYFEKNTTPDIVAGHSLGEYNALLAAGVFDFPTGLQIVKKRGELMGMAGDGAMAAVVGLTLKQIEDIISSQPLQLYVANVNTPVQIVISGKKTDIAASEKTFLKYGAMAYKILNTSGAFHCPYLAKASSDFAEYLTSFVLKKPQITVISNYTAKPYSVNVLDELICQMTNRVLFTDSVKWMIAHGCDQIEQVGPGKVVKGLIKQIKSFG